LKFLSIIKSTEKYQRYINIVSIHDSSNFLSKFYRFQVFFVDFGNTEWLPEDEIADIKPEFLHLPFQAVECFMYVEPKSDDKWTQESKLVIFM
jgi:hypothetical protein